MRYLLTGLLVLGLLVVGVFSQPPQAPDPVTELKQTPRLVPWTGLDEQSSWALAWMAVGVPYDRWYDIRFVSWNAVPDKVLPDFKKGMTFWMNQLHFKNKCNPLTDVPGTDGKLQYFYLSDFGWSAEAWQAVAQRDPYCREERGVGRGSPRFCEKLTGVQPQVKELFAAKNPPTTAEALRQMIGYTVPDNLAKEQKTFPLVSMVWGPFLFRDTFESNRSTSYYDLLFSKNRFGKGETFTTVKKTRKVQKVWKGGVDYAGKYFPPGYQYEGEEEYEEKVAVANHKFVDFPKNVNEWDQAFGVDVVQKFAEQQYLDLTTGIVVEGGQDQPKVGSIVTLHNRLVRFINGPLGTTARTFDVFDPVGVRDYIEQAPKLALGHITFDASELIYQLPNGGIGTYLTNAKGDRTELAGQEAASGQNVEPKLNPGVRNPGDCFICHAGSGGYIPPRDGFKKLAPWLKEKDKALADRMEEFYLGTEKRIEGYQKPFQDLCKKLTGWDGATLAGKLKGMRDWYDTPVDINQAAAEFGLEVGAFEALIQKSPSGQVLKLAQGDGVTRRTWEVDTYKGLGLLFAAQQR